MHPYDSCIVHGPWDDTEQATQCVEAPWLAGCLTLAVLAGRHLAAAAVIASFAVRVCLTPWL
jgi:hypothetical protein